MRKRIFDMLLTILARGILPLVIIMLIIGPVWAGTVTQKPYGISTPQIYDYSTSTGVPGAYYLDMPTLSANDTFCGLTTTQTLTNKTLTSPTITGATLTTTTLTTPVIASFYQDAGKTKLMTTPVTASDTLCAIAATQTLTNKTLTTPIIASFYQDAGKTKLMTVPDTASDTLCAIAAEQTLTNKTLTTPIAASIYQDAGKTHLMTLPALTGTVGIILGTGATVSVPSTLTTNGVDVANSIWGMTNGLAMGGATGADGFELQLMPMGDPAADKYIKFPVLTDSAAMISSLVTNDIDVANSVWGVSNGVAFGGATGANGFEVTLSPQTDPTGSVTVSLPSLTNAATMISTLTTNDVDVANSIWGVSNGVAFGGATGANGFELTVSPMGDPAADHSILLPVTTSSAAMISALTTNDVDVANSVWGISNGLAMGGLTGADGFELQLKPMGDPAADKYILFPVLTDSAAMISSLTTNDVDVANSIWGVSNGLAFGGASGADGFETTLSPTDPTADRAITLPDESGAVALLGTKMTSGSGTGVTVSDSAALRTQLYKVTVGYTQFDAASTTHDLTIGTLPAKAVIHTVVADVTQAFVCAATCTTGTLSATLGTSAGDVAFLESFDLDAAAATFGDADAEVGDQLDIAADRNGGYVDWDGATIVLRATSGTGNWGDGAGVTNLNAGSITFYVLYSVFP